MASNESSVAGVPKIIAGILFVTAIVASFVLLSETPRKRHAASNMTGDREVVEVKLPGEDFAHVTRYRAGDFTGTIIEVLPVDDMPWIVGLKIGRFLRNSSYDVVVGFGATGIKIGDKVVCVLTSMQAMSGGANIVRFCAPAPVTK